jgi:hypothetical protein
LRFANENSTAVNCKDTQEIRAKDLEELANLGETRVIFQKAYAIGGPVLNLVSPKNEEMVGLTSRRVFYG